MFRLFVKKKSVIHWQKNKTTLIYRQQIERDGRTRIRDKHECLNQNKPNGSRNEEEEEKTILSFSIVCSFYVPSKVQWKLYLESSTIPGIPTIATVLQNCVDMCLSCEINVFIDDARVRMNKRIETSHGIINDSITRTKKKSAHFYNQQTIYRITVNDNNRIKSQRLLKKLQTNKRTNKQTEIQS